MNIKKLITIGFSFVIIIASLAGCRKIGGSYMSSDNTSDTLSTVYGVVDIVDENDAIESTNSDNSDDTQANVSSGDGNSSNDIPQIDNVVNVGDEDTNAKSDAPATFIDPDEQNPDDSGREQEGYNNVTLSTAPNAKTGDVVTVKIAANGSVKYKIKGVSNKILTIKNANAYVIYNGIRYDAKNGVLSFTVVSDELASAQILFVIGNKGDSAQSFTINFASPLGSWDNKETISNVNEEKSVIVKAGDEDGYWFKYTAAKDGKLKFYLLSGTESGILMVTNNSNSAQRSTEIDEELNSDDTGKYIELDVKKGNEIVVNVGAKKTDIDTTLTIIIK